MKNNIKQVSLLVQAILVFFVIMYAIIGMINIELFVVCKILVSLLMFVMGYNNQKIFKRKYMTIIYNAIGIIMIASIFA